MRAVIFPGQGAQKLGMAKDFYHQFKAAKDVFDCASQASGLNLARLVFEEEDKINLTEYTQVALVTAQLAMAAAMKQEGILTDGFCDVTCGLSLGEYSALVLAGAMSVKDAAALVRKRGIYMQEAVPAGKGAMAAVLGMPVDRIEAVLGSMENVWIANYNSDAQTVITGLKGAVEQAATALKEAGAKRVVPLVVSGPFHSPLMDTASEKLALNLKDIQVDRPAIPYVANVTGNYVYEADEIKKLLVKQVYSPVKFLQSVRKMTEKGVTCFVEIGPGNTLTKLISKIAPEAETINIATVEDLKKITD
ncbi:MAG: ACP S-malonyltransferase [Lachnospiraceae bacterium]